VTIHGIDAREARRRVARKCSFGVLLHEVEHGEARCDESLKHRGVALEGFSKAVKTNGPTVIYFYSASSTKLNKPVPQAIVGASLLLPFI
jgi:hypothetical protein